jgi:hypothetical protein
MPSRVQRALDFRCLYLPSELVIMPICCRVCHASSAIYVDIVAVCTMMARPLRHGFLDRLSLETHDMETRIITCAVRTFAEAVPPSVSMAHATSLLDCGT